MAMHFPATPPQRPLKGVVLVVFATLAFALADMVTKQQAMRHPVMVVIAVRYLVNLGLLSVFLYPRWGRTLWRVNRRGLVFVRGLCLAFASLTMGLALQRMPIGETVAIVYLSPFAVMLLSIPLLGEKVSSAGWVCAAAGFCGVLLILRPGGGLDSYGVMFAIMNAALATAYHLLTRFLASRENTVAMVFQTALIGSIFFCIGALPDLHGLRVNRIDLAWMGLLGVFSTVGHFLFTAAYREAPVSLLAPVSYVNLVWAGGIGLVVFQHVPEWQGFAGMSLVCAAGVALAFLARQKTGGTA